MIYLFDKFMGFLLDSRHTGAQSTSSPPGADRPHGAGMEVVGEFSCRAVEYKDKDSRTWLGPHEMGDTQLGSQADQGLVLPPPFASSATSSRAPICPGPLRLIMLIS